LQKAKFSELRDFSGFSKVAQSGFGVVLAHDTFARSIESAFVSGGAQSTELLL
jgi:hypothetical protein